MNTFNSDDLSENPNNELLFAADRSAHPYRVWDSLHAAPDFLRRCLEPEVEEQADELAARVAGRGVRQVHLVGIGTSYHSCLAGSHAFRATTGLNPIAWNAHEFLHYPPGLSAESLVIAVSQSGASEVTVQAALQARQARALVAAVTDVPESPLGQAAHLTLVAATGRGLTIPATRSYLSALARLYLGAFAIMKRNIPSLGEVWMRFMPRLPGIMEQTLEISDSLVPGYAADLQGKKMYLCLSSGPNMAIALEAALKLQEMAMQVSAAAEVEQAIHGSLLPVDESYALLLAAAPGGGYERFMRVAQAAAGQGIPVFAASSKVGPISRFASHFVGLPYDGDELYTPFYYAIPFYLLAYWIAVHAGRSPDSMGLDDLQRRRFWDTLIPPGSH